MTAAAAMIAATALGSIVPQGACARRVDVPRKARACARHTAAPVMTTAASQGSTMARANPRVDRAPPCLTMRLVRFEPGSSSDAEFAMKRCRRRRAAHRSVADGSPDVGDERFMNGV